MAEVSEGRVRGRPRLGWMDGVKMALGNRGMTVEAARQCAKDRRAWRALVGVMPLHDAVGINCKKGQLLKITAQVSSIWAKGCILMTVCVCFI